MKLAITLCMIIASSEGCGRYPPPTTTEIMRDNLRQSGVDNRSYPIHEREAFSREHGLPPPSDSLRHK